MTQALGPDLLAPGSIVGPWRLDCRVGRGSYGVVFQATRAEDPESEPVALKLAVYPDDPRFAREVELLTRIRHPSVPALVEQGQWIAPSGKSHPYVVMQWVEGLSLYEWAKVYNPTSRQVLHVLAQVAWALETMHEQVCLHRDVKGDNIKVTRDGKAFLMDFGSGVWAGAPRITDGPMAPGTQGYRGPEAVRFQWYYHRGRSTEIYEAREADDIYALGVSAYRVVTGRYPPPGTDPETQIDPERIPPPARLPPQAVNARVMPELAALIERMLADVPQARPDARAVALSAQVSAERGDAEADVPLSPLKKQSRDAEPENRSAIPPVAPALERKWWLIPVSLCCVASMWCMGRCPSSGGFRETAEALIADKPDAGASGVGDTVSTTSWGTATPIAGHVPLGSELQSSHLMVSWKPDSSGRCAHRAMFAINGGCWNMSRFKPPCALGEYEWKGACYYPDYDRPGQPTSVEH